MPATIAPPDAPEEVPATPHHRLRWALFGVLGGLVLLVVLAVGWFLWARNPPEEVSVEEAEQRFRASTTVAAESPTTVEGVRPFELPPQGVYLADGAGTEDTSFPPVVEPQGPDMPVTVTWTDPDCYEFRIDYNTNHWQTWDVCLTDAGLFEHGGVTFQRRDYGAVKIDSTATFVCDPPSALLEWEMVAGDQLASSCVGTNSTIDGSTTSAGTDTFVGIETLDIGGEELEAYHVRGERDVTGAQTGHQTFDLWMDVRSGLPLQRSHQIEVSTDTPIGPVDYREESEWTLRSLDAST